MAKFKADVLNLGAGLLSDKSLHIATNPFKIQFIPIEQLIENPQNEGFSEEDISDLKQSIREIGLQQNLVVTPDGNSFYRILTGHRRFLALRQLSKEDEKFKTVPCIVKDLADIDLPLSEELKEIYAVATTNAEIRKNTDADKLKLLGMLSRVYDELSANGIQSGSRKEFLAEKLGISQTAAQNLTYIEKHLIPDYKEKFMEEELPTSVALELARKPKQEQQMIFERQETEVKLKDVQKKNSQIITAKQPALFNGRIFFQSLSRSLESLSFTAAKFSGEIKEISPEQKQKLQAAQKSIEKAEEDITRILNEI